MPLSWCHSYGSMVTGPYHKFWSFASHVGFENASIYLNNPPCSTLG